MLDAGNQLAVQIWNVMNGLDWSALPVLVELHGVTDIEALLDALLWIYEYQRRRSQQ